MNQRLEITIEAVLDNRTYRLALPIGAPYSDVFQILDSFKVQVSTMQDIDQQQQAAAQAASPAQPAAPEATWQ